MVYRPCSTCSLNGFTASRPSDLSDAAFTVALATQILRCSQDMIDYPTTLSKVKNALNCAEQKYHFWSWTLICPFLSPYAVVAQRVWLVLELTAFNVLVPKDISFVVHTACELLSRFTGFSWPVFGTQPWAQTPRKAAMFCKTCLALGIAFTPARWKLQTLCQLHSVGFLYWRIHQIYRFWHLSQILLYTSAESYKAYIHTILVQIPDCFFPSSFPSRQYDVINQATPPKVKMSSMTESMTSGVESEHGRCSKGWPAFWLVVVCGTASTVINGLVLPAFSTAFFNGGTNPCVGTNPPPDPDACKKALAKAETIGSNFTLLGAICMFVMSPGIALLCDRYGRKPVLIFGQVVGFISVASLVAVDIFGISLYLYYALSVVAASCCVQAWWSVERSQALWIIIFKSTFSATWNRYLVLCN